MNCIDEKQNLCGSVSTPIHSMKSAITLLLLLMGNFCYGVINFAFEEVGSEVVLTVSGSADLTGSDIFFITSGFSSSAAVKASNFFFIRSGGENVGADLYQTSIVGPLAIGTGTSEFAADSFGGPPIGWSSNPSESFSLVLPFDYT
ncbi:MAG: hypothetical protein AAGJ81_15175 [Verrucomicrobiota bacterium]